MVFILTYLDGTLKSLVYIHLNTFEDLQNECVITLIIEWPTLKTWLIFQTFSVFDIS